MNEEYGNLMMELPSYLDEKNISAVNLSWILNESKDIDPRLAERFATNRNVEAPAFYILIFLYCVLIMIGTAGNTLVVVAVARKPAMRTARNLFILNLAISDLLLCLVTMPLTLVEILSKYWPLGKQPFVCKMIGTLQATSIFVSTISITAIALDRYQVIVYATRDSLQVMGAIGILSLIWVMALGLASPMFMFRTLQHHDVKIVSLGIDGISYCLEDWPFEHGRIYYSIATLVVQYLLPIVIVSAAYLRIYYKLRYRYVTGNRNTNTAVRAPSKHRGRRMKRTNSLLIAIAVIFCISWLPLNIFNVWADLWTGPVDTQTMSVSYAVCHMMGMSSACSNPLLYGWLNDNFRKEFKDILCRSGAPSGGSINDRGETTRAAPPLINNHRNHHHHNRKFETTTMTTTENGHPLNNTMENTEMSALTKC
ncbi:neuropeptide F receptor isoform X1 [Chrysoperla carnea]|uniref:neuropeptide F receptor isoform X1 n=1 Tax=Chrysoperla carnea TaxID=189513 RepID=UPI001D06DD20|nr:neuropeptide F receptor isoform X1 [Chrysoperla carnea]